MAFVSGGSNYLTNTMTQPDQHVLDAIGEAVRVMLLSGEQARLPGLGTLAVKHVPSRQVSDSRGTIVTAPASVIEFEVGDVADAGVLLRAASIADTSQNEVLAAWKAVLDSPPQSLHLPGVGGFAVSDDRLAFSPNPALQHAVNARYTGYVDLAVVHGGDRIDVAGAVPPSESATIPDFERIVDEAIEESEINEPALDDDDSGLDEVADVAEPEAFDAEPWPEHAFEDEMSNVVTGVEDGWTEGIDTTILADLTRKADDFAPEKDSFEEDPVAEDPVAEESDGQKALAEDAIAEDTPSEDTTLEDTALEDTALEDIAPEIASETASVADVATSGTGTDDALITALADSVDASEPIPDSDAAEAGRDNTAEPVGARQPSERRRLPERSSSSRRIPALIAAAAVVLVLMAFLYNRFFLNPPEPVNPVAEETTAPDEMQPQGELEPSNETESAPSTDTVVNEPSFARGAIDLSRGGFTLIVSSKTTEREAAEVAATLSVADNPIDILEAQVDGSTRYRVAVGQFQTFARASRALNQNADVLPEGSWIGRIE